MSGRRAFPCIVSLDVRELASGGMSRQEVVSAIIDTFQPARPIAAVQFLGYDAKVTFEQAAHRREVMECEHIRIKDVDCVVRGGGPRPQNVLIYNFPYEIPHAVVRDCLSHYGDVESVLFRHWTHVHVCDGVRTVRMVRARAIPRNLNIDGFNVKVSYPGQAPECDICFELGHIAKNCTLRGKCLECRQPGHLRRDCPVRLRRLAASEDSVANLRAVPPGSEVPDASPDPDSVVLCGVDPVADDSESVSVDSLVDVRDNQLDEITSQSVLADAIPDCNPPSVSDHGLIQSKFPIVSDSFGEIPNSASQIPNSAAAGAATPGVQPAIATDNDDISEFTSESNNEINMGNSNKVTSDNTVVNENANVISNDNETSSVSSNKAISSDVHERPSENLSSPQIGSNVVSPGSSMGSVSLGGLEGEAQAPRSSVSDSAARGSGSSVSSKIPRAASGVQKSSSVRHTGLRPGLQRVACQWSQIVRRPR